MAPKSDSPFKPGDRRKLDDVLRKTWQQGANFIIGWRARPDGIRLLYLPSYALPQIAKRLPDLLEPRRHVSSDSRHDDLVAAGCKVRDAALPFAIPEGRYAVRKIDELMRYYTVTECKCRAVSLFDIVSFSMHSTFEQITQLSVLAHYINAAAARCRKLGMPLELSMSTTGDGFYVWNRQEGLAADLSLYCATLLAMAYNYAARERAKSESVPQLRCCMHFGNHFEYYQAYGGARDVRGFIVGDVTISLARLIGVALPRQTLIGSYTRDPDEVGEEASGALGASNLDTPSFVALAQAGLDRLGGSPLPGGKFAEGKAYLTGSKVSANEFAIKRYCVVDKHGMEHRCFNAKFNVTDDGGNLIHVGLRDADLKAFNASYAEADDIRVRVV